MKFQEIFLLEKTDPNRGGIAFKHKIVQASRNQSASNIDYHLRRKLERSPKHEELGVGFYSKTFDKKPEFHTEPGIIKITRSSKLNPEHSPDIAFHRAANKHAAGNPHLPRTYHVTSIKAPDGVVHVSHMEKLHPLESLSHEERKFMLHHAFGPNHGIDIGPDTNARDAAIRISAHVHRLVRPPDETGNANRIEGKTPFSKALNLANLVRKNVGKNSQSHIFYDLSHSNMMARKTQHGTHLVITDPLA